MDMSGQPTALASSLSLSQSKTSKDMRLVEDPCGISLDTIVTLCWTSQLRNSSAIQITSMFPSLKARVISKLRENEDKAVAQVFQESRTIRIEGPRDHQMRMFSAVLRKQNSSGRREILALPDKLAVYHRKVRIEEQSFSLVHDIVEYVRRRKRANATLEFDESVLQTKGVMMSAALFLRLDTALPADFLALREKMKG
jgi:hypothetical protein